MTTVAVNPSEYNRAKAFVKKSGKRYHAITTIQSSIKKEQLKKNVREVFSALRKLRVISTTHNQSKMQMGQLSRRLPLVNITSTSFVKKPDNKNSG